MNQNSYKSLLLNLSDLSRWLMPVFIVWVLISIGLGWVVKSILILIVAVTLLPVIGFFGLRWWLSRNLIVDQCPVCSYELTGLNQTQFQCPSCGEPLIGEGDHFVRLTPPGTIDIDAVEVSAKVIEESK